jgi:hypothetical protein
LQRIIGDVRPTEELEERPAQDEREVLRLLAHILAEG